MYCPNVNRRFIPPCGGKADTKRMLIGMTCALGVSRSAETCRRWWSGREAISFSSRLVNAQLRCATTSALEYHTDCLRLAMAARVRASRRSQPATKEPMLTVAIKLCGSVAIRHSPEMVRR